jgi:chromosome segregation ATPase
MRWKQLIWVSLFVLAIAVASYEAIEDSLNLNLFTRAPSADIAQMADATDMTALAKRVFYRQKPRVEPQSEFFKHCKVPDQTIMLGCYVRRGTNSNIVIQQVTDSRMDGMMEVTAAHEMLHAAYDRFTQAKKDELSPHLEQAAKRVKDKRLISVLKDYKAKDLDLYYNELHSHLGTELDDLGNSKLDTHYRRYFTDRRQVLALARQSVSSIKAIDDKTDELKPQIDQLEKELKVMESQLNQSEAGIKDSHRNLEALEAQLNATKQSAEAAIQQGGGNAQQLIAQFNQEKSEFNRTVEIHNDNVQRQKDNVANFNDRFKLYETKIDEYNKAAKEGRAILEPLKGRTIANDSETQLKDFLTKP